MAGERDLSRLLEALDPKLHPERYSFAAAANPTLDEDQFAIVREEEGLTSIHADPRGKWARISLEIRTSKQSD